MLTALQKTKIQLMYYPCKGYTAKGGVFPLTLRDIIDAEDDAFALVLKPLEMLSARLGKKVIKRCGYSGYSFSGIIPNVGIEIEVDRKPDCITWFGLNSAAYNYLVEKGYDMPLYFGFDHPANGKTAIELGLAIDVREAYPSKVEYENTAADDHLDYLSEQW